MRATAICISSEHDPEVETGSGKDHAQTRASCQLYAASALASAGTITIQLTPKRSTSMPKCCAKKVLPSGIVTWPLLDSAANMRLASASFAAVSDSEKPWKFFSLLAQPSDAMSTASPILRSEERR